MASYIITKEIAKNAANCLVRKKFEQKENELTKKEYEYGEFLAHKYYNGEILQFVSMYAEYVGYCSVLYVKYDKLTTIRIDTLLKLPAQKNHFMVNLDEYNAVRKIRDEWAKLKDEKAVTKEYLTEEIMKLRTYNRVKEQAPELLPFLPVAEADKKLPAANYGDLRSFVKSIVETK